MCCTAGDLEAEEGNTKTKKKQPKGENQGLKEVTG